MNFNAHALAGDDPNPMSHVEVDELKRLVSKENLMFIDPIIINIGAERGTSTLAMLEERPDAYIFSIDIDARPGEIANVRRAGLDARRVVRILCRSQEVGELWPFWVSFVWVDGDHSYDGIKGDIESWWPRVRPGGIIALHDYFEGEPPANNPSGAGQVVRELMIGNYELISEIERIRAFRK